MDVSEKEFVTKIVYKILNIKEQKNENNVKGFLKMSFLSKNIYLSFSLKISLKYFFFTSFKNFALNFNILDLN